MVKIQRCRLKCQTNRVTGESLLLLLRNNYYLLNTYFANCFMYIMLCNPYSNPVLQMETLLLKEVKGTSEGGMWQS